MLVYMAILVANGPVQTLLANYREITRTITCGQELAFNASRSLRLLLNNGQVAVLDSLEDTIVEVKVQVEVHLLVLIKCFCGF